MQQQLTEIYRILVCLTCLTAGVITHAQMPSILVEPQDQWAVDGNPVAFSVVAADYWGDDEFLSYRWSKLDDGSWSSFPPDNARGVDTPNLLLLNVGWQDEGDYVVDVTDMFGVWVESRAAHLTIYTPGTLLADGNFESLPVGTAPDRSVSAGAWAFAQPEKDASQFTITQSPGSDAAGKSLRVFVPNPYDASEDDNYHLSDLLGSVMPGTTGIPEIPNARVIADFDIWVEPDHGGGAVYLAAGGLANDSQRGPQLGWLSNGDIAAVTVPGVFQTLVHNYPRSAWQSVRLVVDLASDTYDVQWAPRGQPLQIIGTGLAFRSGSLSYLDRITIARFTLCKEGEEGCIWPSGNTADVVSYFDNFSVDLVLLPAIAVQPQSQIIAAGNQVTLEVLAGGSGPLSYQWYRGEGVDYEDPWIPRHGDTSQPISGATSSTLEVTAGADLAKYWVRVSNAVGSKDSRTATVSPPLPPSITTQPESQTVYSGEEVWLDVSAEGTEPLTYQWYLGASGDTSDPIGGAQRAYFSETVETSSSYWVRVSNEAGTADSQTAIITALDQAPSITQQPASQIIPQGTRGQIYVDAEGSSPKTYQWYQGQSGDTSTPMPEGNDAFFTTPPVTSPAAFWVRVSNAFGDADSETATLTPRAPIPGESKWATTTFSVGSSSPAIGDDGTVFVGSYNGDLYALDGATGVQKWLFQTGASIYSSPAIAVDGTVFVGSYDGNLYAIDGASGEEKWTFQTSGSIESSPAIAADGTVFVGSSDGNLYAIDGTSGSKKWAFQTGASIYSSPAIAADGTVFVGSYDGNLYAIDGTSGSKKWAFQTGGSIDSSPAIAADGTVLVGSYDGNLYAIDGTSGAKKWAFLAGNPFHSSPAIGEDGTVYVGCWDGKVYALDGATGAERWTFTASIVSDQGEVLGSFVSSSPAVTSDGTVYVGVSIDVSVWWDPYYPWQEGEFFALNSLSGSVEWSYHYWYGHVDSSPNVNEDGTVYVGSNNGVHAFYGSAALAHSAWPKFHHDVKNRGLADEQPAAAAPQITTQPQDQTVVSGQSATLAVEATGTEPLNYQWYGGQSGDTSQPILDATEASYTTSALTETTSFWVRVSNDTGSADSQTATVTVIGAGEASWQAVTVPGLAAGANFSRLWTRAPGEVYVWAYRGPAGSVESSLYRLYQEQWQPVLEVSGEYPVSVFGTGANEVFAATQNQLWRSTDNGDTWTLQTVPGSDQFRKITGTPDNVQVSRTDGGIARFDGSQWQLIYHDPDNLAIITVLGPAEGYYLSCWGWGTWDGSQWQYHSQGFDFCDIYDTWAIRDAQGLHWWAVGNNNFSNGIRVWCWDEASGTFGSKWGYCFNDGSGYNVGSADGIWGSSANDVYVFGGLASTSGGARSGRLYHFDGSAWTRLTEPDLYPTGLWGTASDDVWIAGKEGKLFHLTAAAAQAPHATADTITRRSGRPVKVPAIQLLANDTDPDGDSLNVVSVSANSTQGGTVSLSDGWVLYAPPAGPEVSDTFTYTVADPLGLQAVGQVTVTVQAGEENPSANMLPPVVQPDDTILIRFAGIPGRTYRVQMATQLSPPDWQTLATVIVGDDGFGEYHDTAPPGATRFYRTVNP